MLSLAAATAAPPRAATTLFAAMVALGCVVAEPAYSQFIATTTPIPAGEVIRAEHLTVVSGAARPGQINTLSEAIGKEARVVLHPGRPIFARHLGRPTVISRGDSVAITFRRGAISLESIGRALDSGSVGDRVRVMNLDSKLTVHGVIAAAGHVTVGHSALQVASEAPEREKTQ